MSGRAHGPLPVLLVGLTVVTGLVDAFSYLSLAHVFVANMTGNVVFLGFGLAGVGDIAIVASLVAILAFTLGAATGGRAAVHRAPHRGHLLAAAAATQAGLVTGAAVVAETAGVRGSTARLTLVGLLAVAMGGQNAIARRLAVPDLTTTVLTLTVTGLVADATSWSVRFRRLIPIVAMLGGALTGGALLRWVGTARAALAGRSTPGLLCRDRPCCDPPPAGTGLAVATAGELIDEVLDGAQVRERLGGRTRSVLAEAAKQPHDGGRTASWNEREGCHGRDRA
jgi:uncharacterized membrane protein YoaK (UPF0700 family)